MQVELSPEQQDTIRRLTKFLETSFKDARIGDLDMSDMIVNLKKIIAALETGQTVTEEDVL